VHNEFLFILIVLENIYKMYCFEYATNNLFIGRIRGFKISKTALIKTWFNVNIFSTDNFKFGYISKIIYK
jgi:hypothetical protein